ncbi:MAG: outer membrane beta-barrel protein [Bacteroidota bacterium]
MLNDKEWRINPSEMEVKILPGETAKIYKTIDLKSVVIENGTRYYVANVKIDNTPSEFQTAYFDTKLIKTTEARVFLLQEFSSKFFSLYSLQMNGRLHLYIQRNLENPEELIYRKVILTRDGTTYETEDKTYISQLSDLLYDCKSLGTKVDHIKYSINSILQLLKDYDQQCGGNTQLYTNESNTKGKINYTVFAGTTLSKVKFTVDNSVSGTSNDLATKNPLKSDPSVSFGIDIMYVMPGMKGKLAVLLSTYYNSFKSTITEYKNYVSPDLYTTKTININPSLLRFGLLGRYYISAGDLKPYLQAGFACSYSMSHNDELITDDYYNSGHHVVSRDPYRVYGDYKKLQLGFAFGAGLEYKRICLNYKFETTTGFLNTPIVKSHISAHTILLGFRINK